MTKQSDEELAAYYDRQTKIGLFTFFAMMGLLFVAVVVCAVVS